MKSIVPIHCTEFQIELKHDLSALGGSDFKRGYEMHGRFKVWGDQAIKAQKIIRGFQGNCFLTNYMWSEAEMAQRFLDDIGLHLTSTDPETRELARVLLKWKDE